MATNYTNGVRQYDEKNFPQSASTPSTNLTSTSTSASTGLAISSCDIKTDVINVSLKIETNDGIIFHAFLKDIISWDIQGTNILLNTADEVSTTLSFQSIEDTNIASIRIEDIMNGADVQICSDANNSVFYGIITEDDKYIHSQNNDYWIAE